MPNEAKLEQAVADGVAYIGSQQLADGSFESFSSPSLTDFRPDRTYHTTFVPALVLGALASAAVPGSQVVRNRLVTFLTRQASPDWSFNYWAKRAPQRQSQPYPDDLDDTFCALIGLYLHDPKIISPSVLAQAVKLLLATETAVGGPYRTWLVPDTAEAVWLDVDLAVNSNVAYFLSLVSNPLPNITKHIDRQLVSGDLASPYYPSAYPITYYMSRGYSGSHQALLIKTLEKLLRSASTPLDQALCLSSLARLGTNTPRASAIKALIGRQNKDGSWPAAAFCLDPAIEGKSYYNGTTVLTTALAIEALELCRQSQQPSPRQTTKKRPATTASDNSASILALAEDQCQDLVPELRATTLESLRKIATGSNGPEIISMPRHFSKSLRQSPKTLSKDFFETLGLVNLYGWLAYSIYDDFLDDEGKPRLLPSANLTMRKSLLGFSQAVPGKRSFQALVRQVFDAIDGADAWELAHCRFQVRGKEITVGKLPDYQDLWPLADRSLGHTLVPLAILSAQGLSVNDTAFQQVRQAMRHYLIVRQLNDDLHDWQTDLTNGHITYVVARILSDLAIEPGQHRLPSLLTKARRQFWHDTLPAVSQEMQQHINDSRQALTQSNLFTANNIINRLLAGLEATIAETLTTQQQTVSFLKHYRQKAAAS